MMKHSSKFLPALLAALCLLAVSGCAHLRSMIPVPELGPIYHPENIYRASDVLPPTLRRVVLLPLTPMSSTALLDAGAEALEPIVHAELEKSERFEVIQLSRDQMREITGASSWRADDQLPPNFFERLRSATGCDAVLFSQLIRYQPYEPIVVGWKFTLALKPVPKDATATAKPPTPLILWSADQVFDAGDVSVANAARIYYSQHLRNETPVADSAVVLNSPTRFGQYTLNALFTTLPGRKGTAK